MTNGSAINLNGSVVNIRVKSVNGALKASCRSMTIVHSSFVELVSTIGQLRVLPTSVGTYCVEFQVTYADLTIQTIIIPRNADVRARCTTGTNNAVVSA
jgi:hypothetical protein